MTMTRNPPRRLAQSLARLATLAGAAAVLAACASFSSTPEEAVMARAQQRWDAMRADKFADAYQLLAPSYRGVKDLPNWRANYGEASGWTDAKVLRAACESETKCTAAVKVTVINTTPIRAGNTLSTVVDETWVREDGAWYLLESL